MSGHRHAVVAMLVAPVLALVAWYAVDRLTAEQPHAAEAGAAYRLIARSNCRYASGLCDLENGDVQLQLRASTAPDNSLQLELISSLPLTSVTRGFVNDGAAASPVAMLATAAGDLQWSAPLEALPAAGATLRIAVTARGATWYAEVPVVFLQAPGYDGS